MSLKPTSVIVPDTFEGLGISERSVDVEITAEYRRGSVHYSGVGWCEPIEFNILSVRAIGMCAHNCLDECVLREDHEDWFEVLDKIVLNHAVENYDFLVNDWLEVLADGS